MELTEYPGLSDYMREISEDKKGVPLGTITFFK